MAMICTARLEDLTEVTTFLGQAEVSTKGIENQIDHFILLKDEDGSLLGTLGIERLNEDGLLRSLVISPKVEKSILLDMFQQIVKLAREKEIETLYLATNKRVSVEFFALLGFKLKEMNDIPAHILSAEHIQNSIQMGETVIMEFQM